MKLDGIIGVEGRDSVTFRCCTTGPEINDCATRDEVDSSGGAVTSVTILGSTGWATDCELSSTESDDDEPFTKLTNSGSMPCVMTCSKLFFLFSFFSLLVLFFLLTFDIESGGWSLLGI